MPSPARVFLVALLTAVPCAAQILYYDQNGTTAGLGSSGSTGSWTTTGGNVWASNSSGTASVQSWPSSNPWLSTAEFAGTAGTLRVNAPITAGKLLFDTGTSGAPYAIRESLSTVSVLTLQNGSSGSSDGTISVASNVYALITNPLTVGGTLQKDGAGTLSLANTTATANLIGSVSINAGTLYVENDANLGPVPSNLNIASNATLGIAGTFTMSSSRSISLGTGATIAVDSGDVLTYGGTLSGTSLIKTGAGGLTLSGSTATYTGSTTISGGTLTTSGALPSTKPVTVEPGATLKLAGSQTIGSLTGALSQGSSGTVDLGTSSTIVLTVSPDSSTDTTFAGSFIGSGGLTKTGNGKLTLSNTGSSYTGVTKILGGTLSVASVNSFLSNSSLGAPSSANATIQLGSGANPGTMPTLQITGASSSNRAFNLDGDGAIEATNSSATISLSGAFGLDGFLLTLKGASTANNTISGAITSGSSGANGALVKSDAGKWILTGDNPAFTGAKALNGGTLTLGHANALGPSGTISFGGGTLQYGSGITADLSSRFSPSGSQAFRVDTNGNSQIVYATGLAGSGSSLTKLGSGTLTLTGGSTYGGATTINAGTLQLGNDTTTGSLQTSGVTVDAGATLAFKRSDALTFSAPITGGGALTKLGAGTLTLSGTNDYTGATQVSNGTLQLDASSANLPATTALTVDAGATFALGSAAQTIASLAGAGTVNLGSQILTVNPGTGVTTTFSGTFANTTGGLTKSGAGTLTLSGTGNYTGPTTINAGTLQLGASGTALSDATIVTVASGATFALGSAGETIGGLAGAGSVTLGSSALTIKQATNQVFSGTLAGSGGTLTKSGTGLLTLSGNSTGTAFSLVTVNGGTLQLGDGASSGTLPVTEFALGTDSSAGTTGALAFNHSTAQTVSSKISGVGSLTKTGAGTLTLSGLNTYFGPTTINDGTVAIDLDTRLGTAPASAVPNQLTLDDGTLKGTATFTLATNRGITLAGATANAIDVASGTTLTYGGAISPQAPTNPFTKAGTGTLVLTGASTYGGATTVNAGTLQLGNDTASGSLLTTGVTLGAGATLAFERSDNFSFSTPVTGGGSLTKLGAGTLTLTGTNDYTGATQVSNGTLQLDASGTNLPATTALTVDSGATFALGSAAQTIASLAGAGTVNLGPQTLTVNPATGVATTFSGTFANTAGGLTKSGPGTLTLSGTGSYTGPTNITAGTLQLGASGVALSDVTVVTVASGATFALGSAGETIGGLAGAGSVTLGSSALTIKQATDQVFSGTLTGSGGTVTKSGTGQLTLSGDSTGTAFSLVTVSGGTLQLGNGGSSGTLPVTEYTLVTDSTAGTTGALAFNLSITPTISSKITGVGGVTKSGTGTVTLSNTGNTYSGGTTLKDGILVANSNAALGNTAGALVFDGGTFKFGASFTTARPITLASTGTLNLNGLNPTLSGAISGAGNLTIDATGSTGATFSGASDFSGRLTLNGGAAFLTGNNQNATGGVTVGTGATLFVGNNNALGTGTLIFAGGNVSPSSGSRTIANPVSFASSTANIGTGLTFTGTATNTSGANVIVFPSQGGVTFGDINLSDSSTSRTLFFSLSTNTLTVSGTIANGGTSTAGNVTKIGGAGTLLLTGNSTYGGVSSATSGTLAFNSIANVGAGPSALGNPTDPTNGTIALSGNGATLRYVGTLAAGHSTDRKVTTVSGTIIDASGVGPLTFESTANNNAIITGSSFTLTGTGTGAIRDPISIGTGSIAKSGTGTWTLAAANVYSGSTTISQGVLRATSSTSALGSGALVLNGGTLQLANNTALDFNRPTTIGGNFTLTSDVLTANGAGQTHRLDTLSIGASTVTVTAGANVGSGTAGIAFDGTTLTGNPIFNVDAGARLTLGALSDSGVARTITKTGDGTLALGAPASNWAAADSAAINQGTLQLGAANALGSAATTSVTVNANVAGKTALFDLGGFSQAITALTFGGSGSTSSSTNNVSTGAGTLTLGGNVTFDATNHPLGSTLSGNLSLGAATRTFIVGDSANAPADLTLSAAISGTDPVAGIVKTGSGALVLSGTNSYGGGTLVSAGTLLLGSSTGIPTNTAVTVQNNGTTATALFDLNGFNATASALTLGATTSGSTANVATGTGTLTLGGAVTFDAINDPAGATISGNLSLGTATRTFAVGDASAAVDLNVSAIVSGGTNAGLTKTGAGTLQLSGVNTYSGPTTVSAGTLAISADAQLGAVPASATPGQLVLDGGTLQSSAAFTLGANRGLTVGANGGTLRISTAENLNAQEFLYGGIVAGAGRLTIDNVNEGAPALRLSGTNSYTGGTTVLGTLTIDADRNLGGIPATPLAGALQLGGASHSGTLVTTGTFTLDANRGILIDANTLGSFSPVTGTTLTYGGAIAGSNVMLRVNGAGTLALRGASTFTGDVDVRHGVLNVDRDTALGDVANAVSINNGASLQLGATFNHARSVDIGSSGGAIDTNGFNSTWSGVLSGGGTFTKTGAGTLTLALAGSNNFSGGVTIANGTLSLSAAGVLPTSTAVTVNGGALDLGAATSLGGITLLAGSITGSGGLSASTFDLRAGDVSAKLTGFGGLTKTTPAVVTLSGANDYSGFTWIQEGTLRSGASDVIPGPFGVMISPATAGGSATLDLNGFNDTIGGLTFGGPGAGTNSVARVLTGTGTLTLEGDVTYDSMNNPAGATIAGKLNLGASSRTFTVYDSTNAPDDLTVSAIVSGAGGLTKSGPGTLVLSGANTYSGPTVVREGTLVFDSLANLGAPASGNSAIELGVLFVPGVLRYVGSGLALDRPIKLNGDGTLDASGATGTFTITGNSISGVGTNTLTLTGPGAGAIDGKIDIGGSALRKTGAGTWTLSGLSSFTGAVSIDGGTLSVNSLPGDSSSALGAPASPINLGAGTLRYTGTGGLLSTGIMLTGAGTLDASGTGDLVLGGSGNVSGNFGLTLTGSGTGAVQQPIATGMNSVTKTGTGTWTLFASSTYSGGTFVDQGTLALGAPAALNSFDDVTVRGGTFSIGTQTPSVGAVSLQAGSITGSGTLSGSSFALQSGSVSARLVGAGALTKTTTGTTTLSAANTYTGGTTFSAGTLAVTGSITHAAADLISSPAPGESATLTLSGSGAVAVRAASLGGAGATTVAMSGGTWTVADTLGLGGGNTSTFNLSGGTVTAPTSRMGANSGSGVANVSGGTWNTTSLLVGDGGGGTLNVTGGSVATSTASLAASATSPGSVSVSGGALTVTNGLTVGNAASGALTVSGAGTVTAGNVALGGSAGSNGTLSLVGTNASRGVLVTSQVATPASSAQGAISFDGGLLRATGDQSDLLRTGGTGNLDVQFLAGGAFFDNNGYAIGLATPLHGIGGLTSQGAGTLTLSSGNNYTGPTTISGGRLAIAAETALGANPASFNAGQLTLDGGTLTTSTSFALDDANRGLTLGAGGGKFEPAYDAALTLGTVVAGSGRLSLVSDGTLTLSANNTYSGGTTLDRGTLLLGHDHALGDGTLTLNGGTLTATGGARTIANAISVAGSTWIAGTQNLTFTGPLTTTNSAGNTLSITNTGLTTFAGMQLSTTGSTPDQLNGFALWAGPGAAVTAAGPITGGNPSAVLMLAGSGAMTLSGANSYSSATLVIGATISAASAQPFGTGPLYLATGSVNASGNARTIANPIGVLPVIPNLNSDASGGFNPLDPGGLDKVATIGGDHDLTFTGTLTGGVLPAALPPISGAQDAHVSALRFTNTGTTTLSNIAISADSAARLLLLAATGNVSLAGTISNGTMNSDGDLFLMGPGTFTLSGQNTYSGATGVINGTAVFNSIAPVGGGASSLGAPTTVEKGTLFLANATLRYEGSGHTTDRLVSVNDFATLDASGSGPLTFTAASAVTVSSGATNALTLAGAGSGVMQGQIAFQDPGRLTKTGSGTWTLSGPASNQSGTFLNDGVLAIASDANLGVPSGAVTFGGGTLRATSSFTVARPTTLDAGGGTFDVASATTLTWNGNIDGSGPLAKTGLGTLLLGGTNSYSGTTFVNAGTLKLATATALSPHTTINVAPGAVYDANGFNQTVAGLGGSGSIDVGSGGVAVQPTGTSTFNGQLSGTGGLTLNGTGTLVLNHANDFQGAVVLTQGTLQLGATGALPPTAPVTLNPGATLNLDGHAATVGKLEGTGGTVALGTATLSVGQNADTTFGGEITGTGGLKLTGTGTLTLNNTANSYAGPTQIDAGTVKLGANGALPANTPVKLSTGGTLDLDGHAATLGQLEGTGGTVALGSASVTVAQNLDSTFAGTISGTGGLTKSGTGMLTLTGTQTFSGPTSIVGGQLKLNGAAADSAFTLSGGGTLSGNATIGTLKIQSGGILSPGNSPGIAHAGDTTWDGGGNFQLEINRASGGTAGTAFDQLNVTGTLALTATAENPFTLKVVSLTTGNAAGAISDFSSVGSYALLFATTSGGVTGFNANAFALDFSQFANPFNGAWAVSVVGNDLMLSYGGGTAIPEPTTYALLAGLGALALAWRRRRLR